MTVKDINYYGIVTVAQEALLHLGYQLSGHECDTIVDAIECRMSDYDCHNCLFSTKLVLANKDVYWCGLYKRACSEVKNGFRWEP